MENNTDLIKQYKLEEAIKRIQKINEYTFYDSSMVEDDQDPNAMGDDPNAMGGGPNGAMPPMNDPNAMGTDPNGGMPPMGGDPNAMGGDPNAMGGDPNAMGGDPNGAMPPMDDPNAMGGDPNGEMPPMDDPNMMGDDPNAMGDEDDIEDIDIETEQPGDEVVDVDELTQSQETTEFKVDNVDDKLNKVLKIISKFNDAIEANDQKIEDLKKEFQKRNPTAEETLNLRSLASYPFSERPDEYWKKQQQDHPNYNVISDNDVSTADEQKEFEIRKGDIDNFNEREVMKSLGESHIKLSDFLQF